MKIRRGKPNDLDHVYKLGSRMKELNFSRKIKFHEKEEIAEWIKKPKDNLFFVAVDSRKVVGFIYAKIVDKDWCMIDNLAVDKNHRHQRIGTKLLDTIYNVLKKRKMWYTQALVEIGHHKTRKFWKEEGFRQGRTFVWYEKELK